MCWYTDFVFVISIEYDFKYLLSTYYSLKINCGLGVHHSTYANINKNIYKKVRKIVGIGWIG
jgi:hypothetical protein